MELAWEWRYFNGIPAARAQNLAGGTLASAGELLEDLRPKTNLEIRRQPGVDDTTSAGSLSHSSCWPHAGSSRGRSRVLGNQGSPGRENEERLGRRPDSARLTGGLLVGQLPER